MKKIKGTHDLILDELNKWKIVENKLTKLLDKYNYQEIRTPILEYYEVFYHSAQYSEMVSKETFQFQDKKGRIIVLRPEGTAPVIRSYLENKLYNSHDTKKFYYYGPFFRYERPQKGRYRQFHQIGVELINIQSLLSEVEILTLVQEILLMFHLDKAKIKINTLGDLQTRENFLKILKPYMEKNKKNLCYLCLSRMNKNILRIFDCKNCSQKKFLQNAPIILNHLTEKASQKFKKTIDILKQMKINFEIDPFLVRGLDYYTDLVFEITILSKTQQQNLVLGGGGSYNELTKIFDTSHSINCMGFAFGLERLLMVLEENLFFQNLTKTTLDVYLFNLDNEKMIKSFYLLRQLRKKKIKAEMNYEFTSFDKNFKKALKTNPKYIIFIGQKEMSNNKLTVKNIALRTNHILDINELINFLTKELFAK